MAVLLDDDRKEVWANWMRENNESISITKVDLRAAINAIDDWVNTNAAAFNTAIPQPARGVLSARQKARLLTAVVVKRFERS